MTHPSVYSTFAVFDMVEVGVDPKVPATTTVNA